MGIIVTPSESTYVIVCAKDQGASSGHECHSGLISVRPVNVRRASDTDIVCARRAYVTKQTSISKAVSTRKMFSGLTIAALVPRSEEIEVAVVWIDRRGLDGVRAGPLSEGSHSRALERAVRVQLYSKHEANQHDNVFEHT